MNIAIRNLDQMLRSLDPVLNHGVYAYATVGSWAQAQALSPVAMVREPEGITVITTEERALEAGLPILFRAAWITLEVHSDLDGVGLTAAVAKVLADAGISCNVVAGVHHDHLFVPIARADEAVALLKSLQKAGTEEHYAHHLGPIYSWMLGGMDAAVRKARDELRDVDLGRCAAGTAIDLGAGPGAHSIALAERGFSVTAMDTCTALLEELDRYRKSGGVRTVLGDIRSFRRHVAIPPDVILCMGDTLTHLPSRDEVESLFQDIEQCIAPGGLFLATFRDYTRAPPEGAARFIPVRSNAERILTCFLEYCAESVLVHDLLHTRTPSGWTLATSAYRKLRLDPRWAADLLTRLGFETRLELLPYGIVRLSARSAGPKPASRT